VQRACQLAAGAPRGPVFVSVPTEYLMESGSFQAPAAALPALPEASSAALDGVAAALGAAKSPVIVTEEAGRDSAAVEALVALAEKLDAPVLEAWEPSYFNFPRTHPLYAGVAADERPDLLKHADFILLVESVLPWHPPSALPAPGARVAVLGEDPLHPRLPFWGFRADFVLQGQVASALAALTAKLGKRSSTKGHEKKRDDFRERARAAGAKSAIETQWVAHELNGLLPENAVHVNETITHRLDLLRLIDCVGPGGYYEASYGGLGGGLGLALGVKHADPSRPVVLTIGDGAFHYNPVVASFGAAQEHGLPVLVVLFNNAGYLSQKMDVAMYYPAGEAVKANRFVGTQITPRPDYAALARAFGGTGERVVKPAEVRPALERGLAAIADGQLALVDVTLDPV
jgi:acetolactate synthase-1/2/3 large subunit